ncbi:MAG: nucleotidyltransferase domain-containing protein [Erysipelotrichales bacterium]|nr:nucleotidyltransferase domain-containing protein [Erysipelotrichales bacterium]
MNELYNPKIDYLICKYLSDSNIEILDEQLWKDIYNGVIEPETRDQIIMVRAKIILSFIKKRSTKFTLPTVIKCFEILSEENIELSSYSQKVLKEIVKMFKCDSSIDLSAKCLVIILQEQVFPKEWNVEMSKIIHNFIQIKHGLVPTILYHFQTNRLIKLVEENEIEGAILEIKNAYQRTRHFNTKHALIPVEAIIDKINKLRDILTTKYGVQVIYMYGSYSKGTYNEYSDLDLFIKVTSKKRKDIENKHLLLDFLEEQIGISIDGQVDDITFKKNGLKKDMQRYLKKIFMA